MYYRFSNLILLKNYFDRLTEGLKVQVGPIESKGYGLIARDRISKGEILFTSVPFVVISDIEVNNYLTKFNLSHSVQVSIFGSKGL